MNDYSPKERALLAAARKGWGPSDSIVREVRAGVPARAEAAPDLGHGMPGPTGAVAAAERFHALMAFARGPWATVTGLAVVGLISVFGVVLVREHTSSPPPVVPSTLPAPITIAAPVPTPAIEPKSAPPIESVTLDSLPEARLTPPPAKAKSIAAPPTDADAIAEEVALVRAARKALRDGQPAQALASLSRHATRFPRGALRQERMTLQVLSLCETGDLAQARLVRAELARIAPSSPHLERLSCAAP